MEELGPILTLICGSSVITVTYIPTSPAGVAVSCKARTMDDVDVKNIPKEIRGTINVKTRG
jgi:hypothetical protein